jgi:hypothetical protein
MFPVKNMRNWLDYRNKQLKMAFISLFTINAGSKPAFGKKYSESVFINAMVLKTYPKCNKTS